MTGQQAWNMWGGGIIDDSATCCQRSCASTGSSRGRSLALWMLLRDEMSSIMQAVSEGVAAVSARREEGDWNVSKCFFHEEA